MPLLVKRDNNYKNKSKEVKAAAILAYLILIGKPGQK